MAGVQVNHYEDKNISGRKLKILAGIIVNMAVRFKWLRMKVVGWFAEIGRMNLTISLRKKLSLVYYFKHFNFHQYTKSVIW